ncbi:hypothetical protein HanXRQr2_Chr16g0766901 [Helianthus annuus]|uniref:Uncharacterized protein n=1 Tax=Helianthus annuus TaxID=4232 RepID=A0A9K3GZE3_HELAN|nr:hypothetical protein HanXRQr2_Chr16g0766901 [Helianthus annuus]KAJ0439412.1 hypothetical protein HanHA300_Chr16g0625051 [Helianthus annuus]KAJ0444497.1 hypothetical protein HanIR_Chr16g0832481 [Helianthus annuus]KAJ0642166.1 hypothetical protein HanLR1_Chr16g0635321 [Helianthus annuus]
MAELEENLASMSSIAAAKDKALSKLEKDKKGLEEQLLFSEVGLQEAVMVATDEAKISAARTILQARIKMAREVGDPNFDRSAWDLASWEQTLLKFSGDEEQEPAVEKAVGAKTSGAKGVDGRAGGGDAAGGDALTVGDKGC